MHQFVCVWFGCSPRKVQKKIGLCTIKKGHSPSDRLRGSPNTWTPNTCRKVYRRRTGWGSWELQFFSVAWSPKCKKYIFICTQLFSLKFNNCLQLCCLELFGRHVSIGYVYKNTLWESTHKQKWFIFSRKRVDLLGWKPAKCVATFDSNDESRGLFAMLISTYQSLSTRWGPRSLLFSWMNIPSYTYLQPWSNKVCWGYNYLIPRAAPSCRFSMRWMFLLLRNNILMRALKGLYSDYVDCTIFSVLKVL